MNKVETLQNLIPNGGDKTIVKVIVETKEELNKKGNPLKDNLVTKRYSQNLILNDSYQDRVNAQLISEGKEPITEFKSSWHVPLDKSNGYLSINRMDASKVYLKGIVEEGETVFYGYLVDGEPATDEQLNYIEEYKRKSSEKSENKVEIRLFSIDSIKEIILNDKIYSLEEETK
jgi:hypothetical protein